MKIQLRQHNQRSTIASVLLLAALICVPVILASNDCGNEKVDQHVDNKGSDTACNYNGQLCRYYEIQGDYSYCQQGSMRKWCTMLKWMEMSEDYMPCFSVGSTSMWYGNCKDGQCSGYDTTQPAAQTGPKLFHTVCDSGTCSESP